MKHDDIANWLSTKVREASALNEATEAETHASVEHALGAVDFLFKLGIDLSGANVAIDDAGAIFLQSGSLRAQTSYLVVIYAANTISGSNSAAYYYFRYGCRSVSRVGTFEDLEKHVKSDLETIDWGASCNSVNTDQKVDLC